MVAFHSVAVMRFLSISQLSSYDAFPFRSVDSIAVLSFHLQGGKGPNDSGLSRKHILEGIKVRLAHFAVFELVAGSAEDRVEDSVKDSTKDSVEHL